MRAEADRTQAEQVALDRRRTLSGWSPGGVETYTVALVTDPAEMERAAAELSGGGLTSYVVLRVLGCLLALGLLAGSVHQRLEVFGDLAAQSRELFQPPGLPL